MKEIKIITAVLFTALCAATQIGKAQNEISTINSSVYLNAIGFRAGETSGLTFKHFVKPENAFEGILGVWPSSFSITGLYEFYKPVNADPAFNWYYGFGGHVANEAGRTYLLYDRERNRVYRYSSRGFGIGVDGILGLEYKIPPIPFALSLDIKPFMEFNSDGNVYLKLDPGFGLKFVF